MKYGERGRAVPEVGDKLCYLTQVVTDPNAPSDLPSVIVPAEFEESAEERWVHGVCVRVLQRDGEVRSVCIQTPDGIGHIVGRDDWRFSDL